MMFGLLEGDLIQVGPSGVGFHWVGVDHQGEGEVHSFYCPVVVAAVEEPGALKFKVEFKCHEISIQTYSATFCLKHLQLISALHSS